jgi:hypothetical protein
VKRIFSSIKGWCVLVLILLVADNVGANCIATGSNLTQAICAGDTFYVGHFAHTQAGNYTDTLTNVGGCDSIVSLTLVVNPLPVVTFTWDSLSNLGDLVAVEESPETYLTALWCNEGAPLYSNRFTFIGGTPAGGTYSGIGITNNIFNGDSVNYIYTDTFSINSKFLDIITYTYTDSDGCKAGVVDTLTIQLCEGIPQLTDDNSITLYPNPSINQLYIKTENIQPETLSIYDVNGRTIYNLPFKPDIDVSKLSSGVYFVEVKSSGLVARKRFVKM